MEEVYKIDETRPTEEGTVFETTINNTTRKPGGFMQSCVFPCIVKFLVHLLQYLKDTINIIPQTTTKYGVLYENWVSQI